MTQKDEFRIAHIARRRALSDEERQAAGKDMGILFLNFIHFKRRSYSAYVSHDHEIPTRHLINQILAWNAKLAIPAWDSVAKTYELCAFHAQTRLITGRFGVREPEHHITVNPADIRLLLIPGVAFDNTGNRVGHGKGYYDAILAKASPEALKVGVCYDWQIVPSLPAEAHDIPMDFILTDRRILCCNPLKMRAKITRPAPSS